MRSTFRLELDVVLDTDATAKLIAVGKDSFRNQAAVTAAADFRRGRTALAEEFIVDIEDALMDLVEHNPLLTAVNVEVERISCRELEDSARCDGSDECVLHSSGKPVCAADDGTSSTAGSSIVSDADCSGIPQDARVSTAADQRIL